MRRAFWVLLLGAIPLVALPACGSSSAKPTPAAAPTNLRGHPTVEIDARNYLFTPSDVVVDAGTLVTFHNTDTVAHNVKKSADALDFGGTFGIDALNPGASYTFTFSKVGTFPYTCTIHAGMTGKIEVVSK